MSYQLKPHIFHQEFNEENSKLLKESDTSRICIMYKRLKAKQRLCTQHIWFNNQCRKYNVFPNYIHFKTNSKSYASKVALNSAKRIWLTEEIKSWYRIRDNVSEYLYVIYHELSIRLHPIEFDVFLKDSIETINEMIYHVYSKQILKLEKLSSRVGLSDLRTPFDNSIDHSRFVVNLSQRNLSDSETKLLNKGLNFSLTSAHRSNLDVVLPIENVASLLPPDQRDYYRSLIRQVLEKPIKTQPNVSKEEFQALKHLKADDSIVILPADKGKVTVILDKDEYQTKLNNLLTGEYVKIEKDPTDSIEKAIKSKLKLCSSELSKETILKLSPQFSKPPHFYGLPKLHKPLVPLRPIVSSIDSPTYKLSKFLLPILNPLFGLNDSYIKNSKDFLAKLSQININNDDVMVSYDVSSLFTNVPVPESLQVIKNLLENDRNLTSRTNLSVGTIMTLLECCVYNSYFQVENTYYKQISGLPMGGVLSPIISNIFMDHFETLIFSSWNPRPKLWLRYVDDIFCIWKSEENIQYQFLDHINGLRPTIKFTVEDEHDGCLPFLDVLVSKSDNNKINTSIYRKPTFSGQFLNFNSNHPNYVKLSVAQNLFNKLFMLESDEVQRKNQEDETVKFLEMNQYPLKIINQAKKKALKPRESRVEQEKPIGTVVIPYIRGTSEKISKINSKFNVRTTFLSNNTLRSQLTKLKPKNKIQESKNVVYKIDCECDKTYFGQTSRPAKTRIREHIYNYKMKNTDKSKLVEHAISKNHSIKFESSSIVFKEPSWKKRNQIESACMNVFDHQCISQPSLNFSKIFNPIIKSEIQEKVQNSKNIFD